MPPLVSTVCTRTLFMPLDDFLHLEDFGGGLFGFVSPREEVLQLRNFENDWR